MKKTVRYAASAVVATGVVATGVALYRRRRALPPASEPASPSPAPSPPTPGVPGDKPASPEPIPPPHPSSLKPVSWNGVTPLPTAAEVQGDLSRNWGTVPTDLRPLLLKIEEVTGIVGAARFLAVVSYQEARWKANAHNGDEPEEQPERNASWRAYHNMRGQNPPLMFGDQIANFGSGGLFGALAPYAMWTGVQELGDKAPLLGSDPRILFLPRVAAFAAAVYLHRILKGYEIRDIPDLKVGWGSVSLLTEAGRKDSDYQRIRTRWLEDVEKVGIDFRDAATIPAKIIASPKWPGVKAVFDQLVVKLPTPAREVS